MIVIVDYGSGNLASIKNMFKKVGAKAVISSNVTDIKDADKLILPGVGSFDNGMQSLKELGFVDVLAEKVLEAGTVILGICLGMQLFSKQSQEGTLPGLGWLDGETIRFEFVNGNERLKIPHMGWNETRVAKKSRLFEGMNEESRFYFVHSYHFKAVNDDDVLATTLYGVEFVSAAERKNILGVQFHPEKSHKYGMKLLRNFAEFY